MSMYIYGWDSDNKKKTYMGKYSDANPNGVGDFGNSTAGVRRYKGGKGEPTKRGFVGSKTKEYTFSNTVYGTHTITAQSYSEALRIAKSLGYTQGDYKKR